VGEVNRRLGLNLTDSEIENILKKLNFEFEKVKPIDRVLELAPTLEGKLYRHGSSVSFDAPNESSMKVADAKITYDCPSAQIANSTIDQSIHINLADEDDPIYDSTIDIAYNDIELLQMQNNVIKLSEQKKFKEAGIILEDMAIIAENLNDHDKAKVYREQKNKIMRDEQLTLADLNIISSTSSRATIKSHIKAKIANKKPKKRLT
jgi:hypothetical protein